MSNLYGARETNGRSRRYQSIVSIAVGLLGLIFAVTGWAQTTVGSGSIVGTVTDPTAAVVSGAKVLITNVGTGQAINLTANPSGTFASGPLAPGTYKVQVSAKGFSSVSETITVEVGNTASANIRLQLGQESQVVEVQANTVAVNTEQAEVQGVLNSEQIANLPVNGRNFLDLAQLEPGVQIQDGQNFDPTKAGYSSISFGGRFGRTARVNVDGVDISDETVGTTTANIPASAIDEFQLGQSSLDLSNDLTSSGAVNVTTKSGTNSLHGEAFGFIRDHSFSANAPGGHDYPFQREQFGGSVGGAIIKNKLFFFADGERTKQDSFTAVSLAGTPFASLSGGFSQPFRESNLLGKIDYNFGNGAKAFYRYSYFANSLFATFGFGFQVYDNKDYTRTHVVGVDFNTGSFTHSIRFSYLKFQNQIKDVTSGNSALPFSSTGLEIGDTTASLFGPNLLAPQSTPQSNRQLKYDGSKVLHSHTIRYGVSYNRIQGGGFADFFGTAPRVRFSPTATNCGASGTESCSDFAAAGPFPGGTANPLNYPVNRLTVGNGQGFNTLQPALGFPAGGLGPDNRIGLYVGDSWKIKPNFTLSIGVRYDRDTGRTDSDLPADSAINAAFPGYGNRVQQANLNFAPQLGFAWDPMRDGKTVIRGGAGLYFENIIFNNVLFDRPQRLKTGAFNQSNLACNNGVAAAIPVAGGTITPGIGNAGPDFCGNNNRIGAEIPTILSFWNQVKAGNPFNLQSPNPNYIGSLLAAGIGGGTAPNMIGPNYKTPRSLQINFGVQREIRRGMVFSADYLRNVETRTLIGIDANRQGDVSTFNLGAAQAAVAATLTDCGASSINAAASAGGCPGIHPATPTTPAGAASMADFAKRGLGSALDIGAGCTSVNGIGRPCAFGGVNPGQPNMFFLQPEGRSVYNALQMTLKQNVNNPMRGVKAANFQVSYSLSRFSNTGGAQLTGTPTDNDQDFVLQAADNNNPGRYFGPSLLDRTHQISFGGYVDVPAGFRIGLISHFYSPLASSIDAANTGSAGEIFRTDFTGDGTIQDPLPGTKFGAFDRSVDAAGLTGLINSFNSSQANQATPAGKVLIANGVMNLSQLQTLGGVSPVICPPPPTSQAGCPNSPGSQVNFGWLRATDLRLAWHHTIRERYTIEPSVGFYNLFNFANFNLPPNTMFGVLNGGGPNGGSSINGTTRSDQEQFRVGNGTGVYSLGSQRQLEFGLRLTF
jgi:Carboxypeptidase regulatory-like domain